MLSSLNVYECCMSSIKQEGKDKYGLSAHELIENNFLETRTSAFCRSWPLSFIGPALVSVVVTRLLRHSNPQHRVMPAFLIEEISQS